MAFSCIFSTLYSSFSSGFRLANVIIGLYICFRGHIATSWLAVRLTLPDSLHVGLDVDRIILHLHYFTFTFTFGVVAV